MNDSQPRAYGRRASDHPGYQQPQQPQPAQAQTAKPDAHSALQIGLTVLALTTIPLSSWLFIANHVDSNVTGAIESYDRLISGRLTTHSADIYTLQYHAQQLCRGVRTLDPTFSCEIRRSLGGRR